MAQVDIRKVHKSYGKVPTVHGIDLTIADGEFVVLLGPSGCGKSTLLRMIAGLEEITAGEIAIAGNVIQHRLVCQLLGMIRARAPLEDDLVIRIHHVEVTDPTAGNSVDVTLDELGEFLMVLVDPELPKLCPGVIHRHASLPRDRRCGWGDAWAQGVAERIDWERVSGDHPELWERTQNSFKQANEHCPYHP